MATIVPRSATFFFLLLLAFSPADSRTSILPQPQALQAFEPRNATAQNQGYCSYTVAIKTSCSSTKDTRDEISLAFSDAYGNQVYAPRIDDPRSRAFERCSTDTFEIAGPCAHQICSLYVYRSGYDGWKPETVKVYGYNTKAVTFYYNVFVPNNIWYGFNFCGSYA